MLTVLSSWFGRQSKAEVKPGDRYRRRFESGLTATATVLDVRPDLSGVAHVHFTVAVEGSFEPVSSTRILALRSFADTFRDQVA
jgi:hypothetical protein